MQTSPRRALRLVLFALLVSSTLTVVLRQHIWATTSPQIWAFVPALTFAAFTGVFAADRLMAVRAMGTSAPRAMFQVGAAIVFLTLLWPRAEKHVLSPLPSHPPAAHESLNNPLAPAFVLLGHDDGRVRAATCALLSGEALGVPHPIPPGHPLEGLRQELERLATGDAEPSVRHHCAEALGQLPPGDPGLDGQAPDPQEETGDNGDDSGDDDDAPLDDDLTQET